MGFAALYPSYDSGAVGWAEQREAHHPPFNIGTTDAT
jgi:hypothetical protein